MNKMKVILATAKVVSKENMSKNEDTLLIKNQIYLITFREGPVSPSFGNINFHTGLWCFKSIVDD